MPAISTIAAPSWRESRRIVVSQPNAMKGHTMSEIPQSLGAAPACMDPQLQAKSAFNKIDGDHKDGITKNEAAKFGISDKDFKRLDKNGDGHITLEEFTPPKVPNDTPSGKVT